MPHHAVSHGHFTSKAVGAGGYGGFGSTQSTILALKALIAYTQANKKTAEAGELRLYVNDRKEPVAVKAFAAGTLEPLLAMHERDRANGLMDAPWPPVYPKQPDEPARVAPSRARKE